MLLDLGLPDRDGFDVCRELRARSDVPIIVVTARSEEVDRVVGLELGADDYIVKPFGFRELVARIRAVARAAGDHGREHAPRRRRSTATAPRSRSTLAVDRRTRRVTLDGDEVALTPEGVRPPRVPRRRPRRGAQPSGAAREVWDPHWYGPTKTLDVHVASLRKKLGDPRLDRDGARRRLPPARRGRVTATGERRGEAAAARQLPLDHAFVLLVLEIPLGVSYANSVERRLTSDLQHDAFALAIRVAGAARPGDVAGRAARRPRRRSPTDYHDDAGGRVVIVDGDGRSVADSDRDQRRPAATSRPGPRSRRALDGARGERHAVVAHARRGRCSTSRCRSARRPASRARCASRTRRR